MGGDGESWIDGEPMMEVFYLSDQGGMLFNEAEGELWEGHLLFHAPAPYGTALAMVENFVLSEKPKLLWGRIPVGNRPARLFTRKIGFTPLGIRECPFAAEIFVWGKRFEFSS